MKVSVTEAVEVAAHQRAPAPQDPDRRHAPHLHPRRTRVPEDAVQEDPPGLTF